MATKPPTSYTFMVKFGDGLSTNEKKPAWGRRAPGLEHGLTVWVWGRRPQAIRSISFSSSLEKTLDPPGSFAYYRTWPIYRSSIHLTYLTILWCFTVLLCSIHDSISHGIVLLVPLKTPRLWIGLPLALHPAKIQDLAIGEESLVRVP